MGGNFDEDHIRAKNDKELLDAWPEFHERHLYDYGHAGYSGTFAEKPGVKVIQPPQGQPFWDESEAEDHAMNNNDKWGVAFAYRVDEERYYIAGWCSS